MILDLPERVTEFLHNDAIIFHGLNFIQPFPPCINWFLSSRFINIVISFNKYTPCCYKEFIWIFFDFLVEYFGIALINVAAEHLLCKMNPAVVFEQGEIELSAHGVDEFTINIHDVLQGRII